MVKVILLSGGKNSTAMLWYLLTHGLIKDEDLILFVNTTIEFEENLQFINYLDKRIKEEFGFEVSTLRPPKPFLWYVFNKPIVRGKREGEKGYGVPNCVQNKRWCCKVLKRDVVIKFLKEKGYSEVEFYTGYTVNEIERANKSMFAVEFGRRFRIKVTQKFPLIELEWDDSKCYDYCLENQILNPLYRYFPRFGCRFCPCYSIAEWRILYTHFPKYFKQALRVEEKSIRRYGRRFRSDYTLKELKERFEEEERRNKPRTVQIKLF